MIFYNTGNLDITNIKSLFNIKNCVRLIIAIAYFMLQQVAYGATPEQSFYEWPVVDLLNGGRIVTKSNDFTIALVSANGKWLIDDVSKSGTIRPDSDKKPEYITICQSCSPSKVIVIAFPMEPSSPNACARGLMNGLAKSRNQYNVCNSQFYDCSTSVGQAALGWQLLILGTRLCVAKLNIELVNTAIKEAGVYSWVAQRNEELKREEIQVAFNKIKTSQEAKDFINKYGNEDANFVSMAETKLIQLKEKEESDSLIFAQQQKQKREAIEAANAARMLEDERIRRDEQKVKSERIDNHKQATISFRLKLKAGDESHCGMIIEVKDVLAKIQTMTGEKWFRRNQIYPPGLVGCTFYNNVYQEYQGDYFVK